MRILGVLAALYIVVMVGVAASIDEEPLEPPAMHWGWVVAFWPIGLVLCLALIIRRAAGKHD